MSKLMNSTPRHLQAIHFRRGLLLSDHHHSILRPLSPPCRRRRCFTVSLHTSPSPDFSLFLLSPACPRRSFSLRAFDSESDSTPAAEEKQPELKLEEEHSDSGGTTESQDYPSGEFQFKEYGAWKNFVVKCRMLIALPWQRVKKGSVLTVKLRGQVALSHSLSFNLSIFVFCLCF